MKLLNNSGFAAFAFRQYDTEGQLDVVIAARAYCQHSQGAPATREDTDDGFQWEDCYEEDFFTSPMTCQTDLTPEKHGTDVTFLGESFSQLEEVTSWVCEIGIGPISKSLTVSGPGYWKKTLDPSSPSKTEQWVQGPPKFARSVPVDWRLTHGGPLIGLEGPDEDTIDPRNPIGLSYPDVDAPEGEYRVPQITTSESERSNAPAGLGPIAPFWADRSQYAGTYDDDWKENRHPLLPRDFDARFWQCAPPDQIAKPYLRGDEPYKLTNLHPEYGEAQGRLPNINLAVLCENKGASDWHVLNLDGVHFDWRKTDRISLTWRARFPLPDAALAQLTLERVKFAEPTEPARGAMA